MDQAQHFAALGQAGGDGSSGNSSQMFREGLDVTERERKSGVTSSLTFPYKKVKFLLWHRKALNAQRIGMKTVIAQGTDGKTYIIPNSPYLQFLITLFLRFILARWLPFVLMTRRLQFMDEPIVSKAEH